MDTISEERIDKRVTEHDKKMSQFCQDTYTGFDSFKQLSSLR